MFGNNKPFGTATTFGSSTFGAPTPFGQSTNTFGAKSATGNVFGASTFGATAPSTSGLFGGPTAATGTAGLFGQTSTTGFNQPASTSGSSFVFGATSNSGGLFGTTTPATQATGLFGGNSSSAFGTPRPTFGGFGTTTSGTGLFGQTTNAGTGLFGNTTAFATPTVTGTTIKFNPPTGSDTMMKSGISQNISTRHQCITCMKEYENKSLEELRLEDYVANRKGPQGGGITGFGVPTQQNTLFGTPAVSSSAFSFGTTQSKPMFGTSTGTNTFGSNLFGQTSQPQNTGLFGKPVGFGAPTTSAAPSFGFGANTGTSLFGQNTQQKTMFGQTATSTGLFGQPVTTQPAVGFGTGTFGGFGATSQPSTGLFSNKPMAFGTTNAATSGTFNFGTPAASTSLFAPKAPTSFGTTTAFGTGTGFSAFGTSQPTTSTLFGQSKPTTLGFGAPNTGFSATNTSFGASPFSNTGLSTNTGTNLFGGSTFNKAPGFSFGGTPNTGFGGFGQTNTLGSTFNFGNPTGFGTTVDPNAGTNLQQQIQAQQIYAFTANPFGDNRLFRDTFADPKRREEVLKPTNPAAQKAMLASNQFKVSPLPTVKVKPKPITPIRNGRVSLFDGLEDEEATLSSSTFVPRQSVKKLVIKMQNNSPGGLNFTSTVLSRMTTANPIDISLSTSVTVERTPMRDDNVDGNGLQSSAITARQISPLTVRIPDRRPIVGNLDSSINQPPIVCDKTYVQSPIQSEHLTSSSSLNDTIEALHTKPQKDSIQPSSFNQNAKTSLSEADSTHASVASEHPDSLNSSQNVSIPSIQHHPTGIKLTNSGYSTMPTLDELIPLINESGKCIVSDFTICREGYGKVLFPGQINVANLNIDDIVQFRRREITVYPDDPNKPPVGEGLNRKAVITLDGVWPTDKTTHTPIKDPERLLHMGYKEKIENSTCKLGAKFIDYISETGSWVFEVDHFSKYGLEDSDDEEDPNIAFHKKPQQPHKNLSQTVNGNRLAKDTTLSTIPPLPTMTNKAQAFKKVKVTEQTVEDDEAVDEENDEMQNADDMFGIGSYYSPTVLQHFVAASDEPIRIQGMKASFFEDTSDEWDNVNNLPEMVPQFAVGKSSGAFIKPVPIKNFTGLHQQVESTIPKTLNRSFNEPISPSSGQYSPLPIDRTRHSEMRFEVTSAQGKNWLSFPSNSQLFTANALQAVPFQRLRMTPACKITLKSYAKSSLFGKQKEIADIGYFMGHQFRVGWGPCGKLLHLSSLEDVAQIEIGLREASIFDGCSLRNSTSGFNSFAVSISQVDVVSKMKSDGISKKNIVASLETQFQNSLSSFEEGAPIFMPKPGHNVLHLHQKTCDSCLAEIDESHNDNAYLIQCHNVWALCVALWGDIPGIDVDDSDSAYVHQMARREALSNWLITSCKDSVNSEIIDNKHNPSNYLSRIFTFLTARRISEAVKLAQESGDHQLATLLSQLEGNAVTRKIVSKLLNSWEESNAYTTIKYQRLKLYSLLAGVLVWNPHDLTINCCDQLEWRRSLALHLWYYCLPMSSISDAVTEFENSFSMDSLSSSPYSSPPYPIYAEIEAIPMSELDPTVYDVCFHLLKLYCDRSHRLDKLLMPVSFTPDHLDYRLSWLLLQALMSLGYEHLPLDTVCALHCSFASQLESEGLWDWAVFVLLHIQPSQMRKQYVQDLLLKHLKLNNTQQEEEVELFLQEQLCVPSEWIFEAKAIKAHSFCQSADEAWYLLKAGMYSKSHKVVMSKLASDAIVNENYDFLLSYLNELVPIERSSTILDWASGGQVFMDYIYLSQTIDGIVKGTISVYDVEKLQPELLSLCQRLSGISCPTAKDRLCQAEMAKKTATLLRVMLTFQAEKSNVPAWTYNLAPIIKSLPMPEDYALQELRELARNYMLAVTSE